MSKLKWKMQLAFGSAVLTLLAVGAISYRGLVVSAESDRWARHTHEVLEKLDNLRFDVVSIESGVRGFELTGREAFLDSHSANVSKARQDLAAVAALTVDNPKQQRQIPVVEALLAAKIQRSELVIGIRRAQGFDAVAASTAMGPGQRIMTEFEASVDKLSDEELRLLVLRDADTKRRLSETRTTLIFGTILGLLITFAAGWSAQRESSARELAEAALREGGERFRDMANNISQLAWMTDGKGEFLWYNQRWLEYFGVTIEEIAKPGWEKAVHHPDHIERVLAKFRRSFASGEVWDDTFPLRGLDGNYRWFLSRAVPIRDVEGKVVRWFGTNTDITELRNSEEHLAELEGRYRGLLEAAPDAMVVVNQRGEIVLLNVQTERQFGYTRDELAGQQVTNIIPEGFAERIIADGGRSPTEALAQQIGTGIELSGRRKDGTEFPIEIMLSPLESAEGILVTAAIRDIRVRKDAERKALDLRERLEQQRRTFDTTLSSIVDQAYTFDREGRFLYANRTLLDVWGLTLEDALGKNFYDLKYPDELAERLHRQIEQVFTSGERLSDETMFIDRFGAVGYYEYIFCPVIGVGGNVELVAGSTRDITTRKIAEKHLAQMESRYRGLLEAAPDSMVVVNQSGEIVLLNVQAEKQFGYSRDELLGQRVTSIIPEGFAARIVSDALRSTEDALAQQIGTGIELIGQRKNGSEFPIEIMLSPLDSAEGVLVTAAIRDIATRKKAEMQLIQKIGELNHSNKELEQFAYLASHDLQEPLRMVASYTQLLAKRYKGKLDSDADEFISFAVDGANRMQRLIQDLLMYSRVGTTGQILLDASSENALQLALINLRSAIKESGALVTHDPLPSVLADEIQLIQLFQNLVGNAIKYQGPGIPKVHISADRNGGKKWLFSVQDNGLGIDSQHFEKIFGMFQRLHKRDEFSGTGIGLAICKKVVERHGGHISVESQPGHGSTFRFSLAESKKKS